MFADYPLDDWLPVAFVVLMGISILVYVVLDGFDLGVGILSQDASDAERDIMVGSIGPFWDANETWLVLAIGILLTAFPIAHGMILVALYIPATLMLIALILRGVAFEFRAKAPVEYKRRWDFAFSRGRCSPR
jgi:cytochrome bd ubiquinol oxidase subunit II